MIFDGAGNAGSGYKELNVPANLLAAALDKNHTPINKEANFSGASFTSIAKSIGDKHNSPIICNNYKLVSHMKLILIVRSIPFMPNAITI